MFKTTITYVNYNEEQFSDVASAILLFVGGQQNLGKTNGEAVRDFAGTDFVVTRFWSDQAGAQEYVDFLTDLHAANNVSIVTAIEEVTP